MKNALAYLCFLVLSVIVGMLATLLLVGLYELVKFAERSENGAFLLAGLFAAVASFLHFRRMWISANDRDKDRSK